MFEAKAMIHSLSAEDTVTILHKNGSNDVVAEYNGKRYTAIFNIFVGLYYVDNLYGELPDQNKCPMCGASLPPSAQEGEEDGYKQAI
jgi:hypothetical protein